MHHGLLAVLPGDSTIPLNSSKLLNIEQIERANKLDQYNVSTFPQNKHWGRGGQREGGRGGGGDQTQDAQQEVSVGLIMFIGHVPRLARSDEVEATAFPLTPLASRLKCIGWGIFDIESALWTWPSSLAVDVTVAGA